jgi:hypothetical protein
METRWRKELGVFERIFPALPPKGPKPKRIMIDAVRLSYTQCSGNSRVFMRLAAVGCLLQMGLNSKVDAVCDGKALVLLLSDGQTSDHKGARLIAAAGLEESAGKGSGKAICRQSVAASLRRRSASPRHQKYDAKEVRIQGLQKRASARRSCRLRRKNGGFCRTLYRSRAPTAPIISSTSPRYAEGCAFQRNVDTAGMSHETNQEAFARRMYRAALGFLGH